MLEEHLFIGMWRGIDEGEFWEASKELLVLEKDYGEIEADSIDEESDCTEY